MSSVAFEKLSKEGFTIRPATVDDLEAAVNLFNAFSLATIGVKESRVKDIGNQWQTPGFELDTATRIVLSPNGESVGFIGVWEVAKPPVHPRVWGCVHPDWEHQGIGTSLMTWAQARARQAIAEVPENARVTMYCDTISTHEPSKRLLEGLGMQWIRHFWQMVIELDSRPSAPQWPEGITLRNYDHGQDAEAVYRAVDEAFRDHGGTLSNPSSKASSAGYISPSTTRIMILLFGSWQWMVMRSPGWLGADLDRTKTPRWVGSASYAFADRGEGKV